MPTHWLSKVYQCSFFIRETRKVWILCFSSEILNLYSSLAPLRLGPHWIGFVCLFLHAILSIKLDLSLTPRESPEILGNDNAPVIQCCSEKPDSPLSSDLIDDICAIVSLAEVKAAKPLHVSIVEILFLKDDSWYNCMLLSILRVLNCCWCEPTMNKGS